MLSRIEQIAESLKLRLTFTEGETSYTGVRPTATYWQNNSYADNDVIITQQENEPLGNYSGVVNWQANFWITIIKSPTQANEAIDTLLNAAAADIIKALMADITQGQLAYNTEIESFSTLPQNKAMLNGAQISVNIYYRTDAADITK